MDFHTDNRGVTLSLNLDSNLGTPRTFFCFAANRDTAVKTDDGATLVWHPSIAKKLGKFTGITRTADPKSRVSLII
jgi:hypothetical protein